MSVILLIRGGEIELHESEKFNKARHRLNKARKLAEDYKNGAISGKEDDKFEPFHVLTFRTADDGRLAVDIENTIGVLSDEPKDVNVNNDDDIEDDDELEDDEE